MIHEVLTKEGKRKLIERRLTMRCLVCGSTLACPDSEDFWFWTKSGVVEEFKSLHHAHAPAKAVGMDIQEFEKV